MALGEPIKLRLSVEKALIYEADAAARGLPLGTYLRERLESQDEVLGELMTLRRMVERTSKADQVEQGGNSGVMLEMLLLLRTLAGPNKVNLVQQEIRRLGLSTWDGASGG